MTALRDPRGVYLTEHEKRLTRRLARNMRNGSGWYPALAAICGVNGIIPPPDEDAAAIEFERGWYEGRMDTEREWVLASATPHVVKPRRWWQS
jgi:hypothetical protein